MGEGQPPISSSTLRLDADALNAFMAEAFPNSAPGSRGTVISAVPGHIQARMIPTELALRPGGLISGPTQMGFADMAAYALVLAHIGPVAMAVTSALNYQFLRPCRPGQLFADAHMLHLGKRLAVMDVRIWTDDPDKPVGQANVTYAIP
ncbi:MAG: PaaI family thioesterase [Alphaproteobacteria bacterium]|nr:PaaI family thioesterase [Alphaproteobacteria bacterium]MBU0863247.1 PaaI family thioesterase [Alphaproteobacteria bacterium]MBU1823805.1 PaaI family thioesterase [Alphaproteobacteria bacterium]